MITLKEAAKIVKEKEPLTSFFDGFEYKNLYVFHVFDGDVWTEGSSLDYHMSVDKSSGECKVFSYWNELFGNTDEFVAACNNSYPPTKFSE